MLNKKYLTDGRAIAIILGILFFLLSYILEATNAADLTDIVPKIFGFPLNAIGIGLIIGGILSLKVYKKQYMEI